MLSRLRDEPRFIGSRSVPAYGNGWPCCNCGADCCCDPAPAILAVQFSGVTDDTATGCTLGNSAKFCLCKFSCDTYHSRPVPLDGSTVTCSTTFNTFRVSLRFLCNDDLVRLQVSGGCTFTNTYTVVATYELARGSWNCSGSNVLTLASYEDDCGDWPATVTVSIDDGTFSCDCQCGGGPGNLTGTVTYELKMGAMVDDTCALDCGCEFPTTRICMRDLMQGCEWEGEWWSNFAGYVSVSVPAAGGCTPAVEAGTVTARTAVLRYESSTNLVVAGWHDGTNWIARYTLAADSFDPFGTNTLTYASGTYDLCTLPGTITVAYFSTDNDDCSDVTSFDGTFPDSFRCTVCGTWSAGFTFTVSGVTGSTIDGGVPCETMNGNYCIGTVAGCLWDTDHGYGPDAAVVASMEITGGVVFLRIGTGSCNQFLVYQISVDDFDCTGTNTLDLVCDGPIPYAGATGETDCGCATAPATITITPTEECGTPPPGCECLPKASYSPRALITGIGDGTCTDCGCLSTLDLCFAPTGSTSECTWRADFTLPTSAAFSCTTDAAYALLSIAVSPNPDDVVIGIYDSGNTLLAQFSGTFATFGCDDSAFVLGFDSDADDCDWSGATCTLDMHGAACDVCVCDPGLWLVSVQYASNEYTWCVGVGECSGDSGIYEIFSGGGAGLSVTVELGELPASYARVLVYYYPDAGVPGTRTLIGVYNYLSAMSGFSCSTSSGNVLHLATGNAGQCGADVDETQTADLDATASLSATTSSAACPTCDGDPMPPTLTATFANNSGNCCDNALSTTLVWDSVANEWYGEITGCSSGETIQITLEQTGTTCSSFRMTVAYVNSCDPGVSDVAPEAGCSCGSLTFNVTGDPSVISDDFVSVTW